jgi:hypothetical protein
MASSLQAEVNYVLPTGFINASGVLIGWQTLFAPSNPENDYTCSKQVI